MAGGESRQTGRPLDRVANPPLRTQAHGESALSRARLVFRGATRRGDAAGLTPPCQGPSRGSGGEARRGLATPARTVSPESGDFGFRRLAADGGGAGDRRLVRLPRLAGDVGIGIDRTLGRSHQCGGGKPRFGGELAGAGGAALKSINPLAVLVAIVVGELGGEIAGLRDPCRRRTERPHGPS